MHYVYHGVPQQMVGQTLIPLNQMQVAQPELFTEYVKKYEGREEILQRKIPLLDCLWNDVVQFLPLDPMKVFGLQRELQLITEVPPYQFFKIDLANLDPSKTVVYFKSAPGEENVTVKWLKNVDFTALQDVPAATRNYYQTLVGKGESPFNYQFIPHILYFGTVDTSNAPIITLPQTT